MRTLIAALVAVFALSSPSFVQAQDAVKTPAFRPGLWHFKWHEARPANIPYLAKARKGAGAEYTRCVDPTLNMKNIIEGENIGDCRPTKAVETAHGFIVANRCDYKGPVRTEVTIKSDQSYTEVNEQLLTERTDTVVAHRLGDCDPPK